MKLPGQILSSLVLSITTPVLGQELPPLPYIDQGACPFECCVYGSWTARQAVVTYAAPKDSSPVAFVIKKRQVVTAETGFVKTTKAGVTKVVKPISLGYDQDVSDPAPEPHLHLRPGELLYTLHYQGEGFDLFWYRGKAYSDQIASDAPDTDPPHPELNLQVLSRPVAVWWVKVRTKNGRIGWLKNPPYFKNSDACS